MLSTHSLPDEFVKPSIGYGGVNMFSATIVKLESAHCCRDRLPVYVYNVSCLVILKREIYTELFELNSWDALMFVFSSL